MQIYDPYNQRNTPSNGSYQPLARNIATALCHQYLEKNNSIFNNYILSPEMERYVATVVQRVNPELYRQLTNDMPAGKYAWSRINNSRNLRDTLNRAL